MMTLQNFGIRPTSSSSKLMQRRNKANLKLRCDCKSLIQLSFRMPVVSISPKKVTSDGGFSGKFLLTGTRSIFYASSRIFSFSHLPIANQILIWYSMGQLAERQREAVFERGGDDPAHPRGESKPMRLLQALPVQHEGKTWHRLLLRRLYVPAYALRYPICHGQVGPFAKFKLEHAAESQVGRESVRHIRCKQGPSGPEWVKYSQENRVRSDQPIGLILWGPPSKQVVLGARVRRPGQPHRVHLREKTRTWSSKFADDGRVTVLRCGDSRFAVDIVAAVVERGGGPLHHATVIPGGRIHA